MKLYEVATDKDKYKIVGTSIEDVKTYISDNKLYDKVKKSNIKIIRPLKSLPRNTEHITVGATFAVTFNDKQSGKIGLIKRTSNETKEFPMQHDPKTIQDTKERLR